MKQVSNNFRMRGGLRSIILLSGSLFYLGFAYFYFDIDFTNLSNIEPFLWLIFGFTTVAGIFVGASRLRASYLYFFVNFRWLTALKILTSSSLVGQIFSSFFAGTAHRVLNPTTREAGSSNIILVAIMEKLATFGIIVCVGLIGLFMTDNFSLLGIEFNDRTIFLLVAALGLLLTIFFFAGGVAYLKTISRLYLLNLSFTGIIVILNAIPVFLVIYNFSNLSLPSVYFLTSAVMFAAALPISANGLGMRESAVLIFLGPQAQDISIILTAMFALSLTVFIINLLLPLSLALINAGTESEKIRPTVKNSSDSSGNFSAILLLTCALSVPVLTLFQLEGVISSNNLTLSVGDLFALWILVASFPILLWTLISNWRSTRIVTIDAQNSIVLLLAVTLLYFLFSACLSVLFVGYTSYSFVNRFFGLFVLFGCFFSGATVGRFDGKNLKFLFYCLFAILVVQLAIPALAMATGYWHLVYFVTDHKLRLIGFQNNPNAFGFTVLMILNFYMIARRKIVLSNHIQLIVLTVFVTSIMLSGSRSVALASLPLIMLLVYQLDTKVVSRILLTIIFCLILGKSFLVQSNDFILNTGTLVENGAEFVNSQKGNDVARLSSIWHGLNQFLKYPIFGCGLGCAFETSKIALGIPIVPHNTFAWILGDLGLVGLFILLSLPLTIGFHLRKSDQIYNYCVFLISVSLASMFHEFFYQRFFWIVLGMYFALSLKRQYKPVPE